MKVIVWGGPEDGRVFDDVQSDHIFIYEPPQTLEVFGPNEFAEEIGLAGTTWYVPIWGAANGKMYARWDKRKK